MSPIVLTVVLDYYTIKLDLVFILPEPTHLQCLGSEDVMMMPSVSAGSDFTPSSLQTGELHSNCPARPPYGDKENPIKQRLVKIPKDYTLGGLVILVAAFVVYVYLYTFTNLSWIVSFDSLTLTHTIVEDIIFLGIVAISSYRYEVKGGLVASVGAWLILVLYDFERTMKPDNWLALVFILAIGIISSTLIGSHMHDKKDREQTLNQISESEGRYRALVNLSTEAGEAIIMLQDIDGIEGIQTFVGDQWPRITGYTKDELFGISFFDILSTKDRPASLDRHRQKMSGKSIPGLFEMQIIRKDGRVSEIELTGAPTVFKGQPANVAYIRDITIRKQIELMLRKTNDLYLTTINMSGDIIIRLDYDNRIIMVNRGACKLFGESEEELMDGQFAKFLHPDDAVSTLQTIKDMRQTGKPIHGLVDRQLTPSGTRTVEWNCHPFYDENNHFEGWQATGRDVTEQMEMTEEVIRDRTQIEALRESEKMKSELLCLVSHELRTPLASIKGFASTLLQPDVEWNPDQQKGFIEEIDHHADRLSRMVSDLLDMSYIEAGMLKLKRDAHTVTELLEAADGLLVSATGNHQFLVDVTEGLPPVFIDKDRIIQVLTNLVDNAAKFSKEGNSITLQAIQSGEEIIVTIVDQGIGISPDLQDKIFDRFYQVGAITTNRNGTGLGLSICRGIIQAHGGRIWVESKEGKGSKFSFSLRVWRE